MIIYGNEKEINASRRVRFKKKIHRYIYLYKIIKILAIVLFMHRFPKSQALFMKEKAQIIERRTANS